MATNVKYSRNAIRLMRDGIKSKYKKDSACSICSTTEQLELHHYHTVSLLVKNFAKENHLDFSNEDIVLENRESFYSQYWHELVEDTVTLCAMHHKALHKTYSSEPALATANKQKNWVKLQHIKFMGIEAVETNSTAISGFERFLTKKAEEDITSGFTRFL